MIFVYSCVYTYVYVYIEKYCIPAQALDIIIFTFFHRVTMPPFGTEWQKHFRRSGSKTLERLGDLMYNGPSVLEGLQRASEK